MKHFPCGGSKGKLHCPFRLQKSFHDYTRKWGRLYMPRMVERECRRRNEEIPWDGMVNVEVVEGSMEPFSMNEVKKGLEIIKNGKVSGPTGFVREHIAASPHRKQVILQVANEILDGKDMPHD